ncbi:hypothetical protein DFH28DRAFT_1196694 [Melampsora americana]|nr:hypothetical protein DFH28DRAFT_1196694 [Melampsora americana]
MDITNRMPFKVKTETGKLKAKWDPDDDQAMIDVLLAERQPADGKPIGPENAITAHSFKPRTWEKVAEVLKGSEEKKVNGITHISLVKNTDTCKSRFYALRQLYNDYKYLDGLSGAGWVDGCITLPDEDKKKSKDYLRCKGRPFPLFNELAPLIEGHQATAKYVKSAIPKPPPDQPPTPSTSPSIPKATTSTNTDSPASSHSDLPRVGDHPIHDNPIDSSASDDSPTNRHGKSAVALKERAPVRKKKRSGVDIVDGLSSNLEDMGSFFKTSISSASSAVESTAQSLTATRDSPHAQAVALVYKSQALTRPQCFAAVSLFAAQPLLAETYLSTPPDIRDEWLLTMLVD